MRIVGNPSNSLRTISDGNVLIAGGRILTPITTWPALLGAAPQRSASKRSGAPYLKPKVSEVNWVARKLGNKSGEGVRYFTDKMFDLVKVH